MTSTSSLNSEMFTEIIPRMEIHTKVEDDSSCTKEISDYEIPQRSYDPEKTIDQIFGERFFTCTEIIINILGFLPEYSTVITPFITEIMLTDSIEVVKNFVRALRVFVENKYEAKFTPREKENPNKRMIKYFDRVKEELDNLYESRVILMEREEILRRMLDTIAKKMKSFNKKVIPRALKMLNNNKTEIVFLEDIHKEYLAYLLIIQRLMLESKTDQFYKNFQMIISSKYYNDKESSQSKKSKSKSTTESGKSDKNKGSGDKEKIKNLDEKEIKELDEIEMDDKQKFIKLVNALITITRESSRMHKLCIVESISLISIFIIFSVDEDDFKQYFELIEILLRERKLLLNIEERIKKLDEHDNPMKNILRKIKECRNCFCENIGNLEKKAYCSQKFFSLMGYKPEREDEKLFKLPFLKRDSKDVKDFYQNAKKITDSFIYRQFPFGIKRDGYTQDKIDHQEFDKRTIVVGFEMYSALQTKTYSIISGMKKKFKKGKGFGEYYCPSKEDVANFVLKNVLNIGIPLGLKIAFASETTNEEIIASEVTTYDNDDRNTSCEEESN